jgi:hypothetical protein
VSLLLAEDSVTLYPAGYPDGHGWVMPEGEPIWHGLGNLQPTPGRHDPRAAEGGGHGPFAPEAGEVATLYLPPDAPVADGVWAEVRGVSWYLSQARLMADPFGLGGDLTCWQVNAASTSRWPEGGAD